MLGLRYFLPKTRYDYAFNRDLVAHAKCVTISEVPYAAINC